MIIINGKYPEELIFHNSLNANKIINGKTFDKIFLKNISFLKLALPILDGPNEKTDQVTGYFKYYYDTNKTYSIPHNTQSVALENYQLPDGMINDDLPLLGIRVKVDGIPVNRYFYLIHSEKDRPLNNSWMAIQMNNDKYYLQFDTPDNLKSSDFLNKPKIFGLFVNPQLIFENTSPDVFATIWDESKLIEPSSAAILFWSTDDWSTSSSSWMNYISSKSFHNYYEATIPSYSANTIIKWYVWAINDINQSTTSSEYSYTVQNSPMTFNSLYNSPNPPTDLESVKVYSDISDPDGVNAATLYRTYDGWTNQTVVSMNFVGGMWSATIPATSNGTVIEYKVVGIDDAGDSTTSSISGYTVTNPKK